MESGQIIMFLVLLILGVGLVWHFNYSKKKRAIAEQDQQNKIKRYTDALQSYGDEYEKEIPIVEADIALKKGENLHGILRDTKWMEYRKVRTGRVAGFGVTTRIKIAKGVYLRGGQGQYVSESVDQMKVIDTGDLYFTNKGLLFRGDFGNKSLPYSKIINMIPFTEGLKIERDKGKDIYMPCNFASVPYKAAALVMAWDKVVNS